jgi:hypothetical protein
MAFIENGYLFSNVQDVKGNNAVTVCSNVSSKNNAPTNKDAWAGNINAQIGGMTVVVVTQTENIAGGTVTPALYTHTANNLNLAGTLVATLPTIANASAIGTMVRAKLPAGTERLKFLGLRYTNAGNITAANVSAWMETGEGQVID